MRSGREVRWHPNSKTDGKSLYTCQNVSSLKFRLATSPIQLVNSCKPQTAPNTDSNLNRVSFLTAVLRFCGNPKESQEKIKFLNRERHSGIVLQFALVHRCTPNPYRNQLVRISRERPQKTKRKKVDPAPTEPHSNRRHSNQILFQFHYTLIISLVNSNSDISIHFRIALRVCSRTTFPKTKKQHHFHLLPQITSQLTIKQTKLHFCFSVTILPH